MTNPFAAAAAAAPAQAPAADNPFAQAPAPAVVAATLSAPPAAPVAVANPFAGAAAPVVTQPAPPAATVAEANPFGAAAVASNGAGRDPMGDPDDSTREARPRVFRDLIGQPVMYRPISRSEVVDKYNEGQTKTRVTADVVVLGTQVVGYGGTPEDPDDPKPHTMTMQAPFKLRSAFVSQTQPVEKAVIVLDDKSAPRWIIGLVVLAPKVEGKKRAVIVEKFDDTTPERAHLRQLAYQMGRDWFAAHPEDRHDPMG